MIHLRHPAIALALAAFAASACKDKAADTASPDEKASPSASGASVRGPASANAGTTPTQKNGVSAAPTDSAATPVAAVSSGAAAATPPPPPPCTIDTTTVVDHGALAATGLTTVRLDATHTAIGYAVGGGTPKVMVIDGSGATNVSDVEWGHLRDQEKKGDKMVRVINRVTPLGFKNGKMRVGVDLVDTSTEKNARRYARCGPADSEPIVSDDTPLNFFDATLTEDDVAKLPAGPGGATDMRDCRTFSNGEITWTVASMVQRASADNHELRITWVIDDKVGKDVIAESELDQHDLKPKADKKYPPLDHFMTPVSVNAGKDGYVMMSREGGGFVYSRRTDALHRAGGPWHLAPGSAPGFPSITHEDERVFVAYTSWGKSDLLVATFKGVSEPPHAAPVALTDSKPPTSGMRDMVSLFPAQDGNLFVSFIDDKTDKTGRSRFTIVGPDLKQRLPDVVDVSAPEVHAIESRVVSLGPKKALVATLAANGELGAAVLTCK